MVDKAQSALERAMDAESYSIGGRSLNRAKVKECQEVLDLWLGRLATAQGKRHGKALCVASIPH